MDLSYREVYAMNREEARRQIVETYMTMTTGNLSETARLWRTSRHLVRKPVPALWVWVRRYQEEGLSGLADRSRRPKRSPKRTPAELSWRRR